MLKPVANCELTITDGSGVICSPSLRETCNLVPCMYEEADTRIMPWCMLQMHSKWVQKNSYSYC